MKLNPLGERLVIKKLEREASTPSGILLPTSAQEQPQYAEVVAVGQQIEKNEETKGSVKIGDRVIYAKYAGTEVKLDGEDYIVIKLEDVMAVVEE